VVVGAIVVVGVNVVVVVVNVVVVVVGNVVVNVVVVVVGKVVVNVVVVVVGKVVVNVVVVVGKVVVNVVVVVGKVVVVVLSGSDKPRMGTVKRLVGNKELVEIICRYAWLARRTVKSLEVRDFVELYIPLPLLFVARSMLDKSLKFPKKYLAFENKLLYVRVNTKPRLLLIENAAVVEE
jgi:hypothetical protein